MQEPFTDTLDSAIADWQTQLILTHAQNSIATYLRSVDDLADFLRQHQVHTWKECTPVHMRHYFASAQEVRGLSQKSLKLQLSAFRIFFEYLVSSQYIAASPVVHVRIVGKQSRLPRLLDVDVVYQLLEQPSPTRPSDKRLWLRDKAMFELLYSSGLRVSELVGVNVDDIDLGVRCVQVLGKGSKQRRIPVGKKAISAIMAYLPVRQLWQKDDMALFISQSGKRLTVRSVQLRLNIQAARAGIGQNLHPHLLRHAFASHLLSSSGDLRAVQEMLGHSSLSATQIYTHLDFTALAKVYDHTHPRAKKDTKDE